MKIEVQGSEYELLNYQSKSHLIDQFFVCIAKFMEKIGWSRII
jgi:hypothetical protein